MITNKNFYPTFWTQFFGALNDNFFKNALITLFTVKNITFFGLNNIQLIGLASAIFIFPFFLFSSLSAELANKYPKDKLSQKLKIMELVAIVIGLLGVNTHNTLLCMFTLFLLGLQATLYGPIKYSILTELIDESNLTKANSIIEAGTFIGILIGTIGGGIIIQHFDNYYLLNSLAIIFSVIGLLFSLKIPKLFSVDKDQSLNLNVIKQTGKIIKETYKHKNLFMTILGISWFWGLGVFVLTMIPIISKNLFSLEYLPYFLMTFTLGVAIGSILCEKISNHALELGLVPLSSFGMLIGLSLMTLSLVQMNVWFFIISLFIFSVFGGIYSIPLYTFLQLRTSNEERSFYIASNNIINALFMVLFSLGITLLNALHVSIVNMFITCIVATMIVSIYIYKYLPEFMLRMVAVIITKMIYKIKVKNMIKFQHDKAYIITSNHISFVDWLIISSVVNKPVVFVMHYSFYNIPIIKYLLKDAKVIPIASEKENAKILEKSFLSINESLKNNEILCIFPEGKISYDGQLNSFKQGITKIAINNPDVDIVPLAIKGMYGSSFSRKDKSITKRILSLLKNYNRNIELVCSNETLKYEENIHIKIQEITNNMLK